MCPSGQAAYNSVFVWVSLGSAHAAAWSKMTTFTGLCGMGANHGRVPAGTQRLRAGVRAGTRAIRGQHSNGEVTFLAYEPKTGQRPAVWLPVRAA